MLCIYGKLRSNEQGNCNSRMRKMSKALVVGGSSGIGLAVVIELLNRHTEHIYILDKSVPCLEDIPEEIRDQYQLNTSFTRIDLNDADFSVLEEFVDVDTLIITAGFGRIALFEDLSECEIKNLINVNELATIQIIRFFYPIIKSEREFYCATLVSICGHIVSPFFSVYGAAKAGLAMFIENVNTELAANGFSNRILDCSPGTVKGTAFRGERNQIPIITDLANEILVRMYKKETLFIPQYDEIFKDVIERYRANPMEYGLYSYEYKQKFSRISNKHQVVVGYLSGTFDLFHIGHLNLLRRAKAECDYLIVGVHESGAWKAKETFIPFEERMSIVGSIKYVDRVVKSFVEDSDAWEEFHYDRLFVGSDYKGTERFERYERYFEDKDVRIIYFPYTQGTSSTQMREVLDKSVKM